MRQRQRIKGVSGKCCCSTLRSTSNSAHFFFVVIEFQTALCCTAALDSPCETNQLSTLNTNVDSLRRHIKSPYLRANVERVPTILSAYRMAPKNIYCDIFNPVHRDVPCVPPLQQWQKSNLLHSGSDRSVDFPSPHPTVSTPVEKILLIAVSNTYNPCAPRSIRSYLDRPEIREMLGVDPSLTLNFSSCSNAVGYAFYKTLDEYRNTQYYVAALLERGVRVLIYVGTYDWICNWVGNERWTLAMEWSGQDGGLPYRGVTKSFT